VAPAYTLGTTIALVVVAVGLASPAAVLVSFFPVLFIALAYNYLNKADPNCGASYSWISRTLNPYVGWFTGWVQLANNVLFCTSAALFAGAVFLALLKSLGWIGDSAASSGNLAAIVAFILLAFVTAMVVRGIRITADFQWLMVGIEYLTVLGFSIFALIKVATSHPDGSQPVAGWWFNPFSIPGISGLALGCALGVFFFWGWDTAANLNEESKDANENPGKAGIISMFVLLVLFMICATAMQALLGGDTINSDGATALTDFAQQLVPTPWSYLMTLAILTSTLATVQTTLLPSTRLSLSMARDGVFPKVFARIHPSWLTPWVGTVVTFVLCAVGVFIVTVNSTAGDAFAKIIGSIGVMVAFYYGVTGLACAWAFRRMLLKSPRLLFLAGILPVVGAIFLFWIGYVVVKNQLDTGGFGQAAPVLVTMGLGIPLVIIAAATNKTGFFKQKTVAYVGDPDAPVAEVVA
jgi:amino acid transporter